VVRERPVELRHQVRADASLAHQDDGIAVVAEAAEMLALGVGKHEEGVVIRGQGVV
jgi:hypothetical protein